MIYPFSDAWFLTALILTTDWADMKRIISVGDGLNHAIFTPAEIEQALQRLIPAGYVETDGKRYRATDKASALTNCAAYRIPAGYVETDGKKYRSTDKASALADCAAYRKAGLFTQTEVILKRLNT